MLGAPCSSSPHSHTHTRTPRDRLVGEGFRDLALTLSVWSEAQAEGGKNAFLGRVILNREALLRVAAATASASLDRVTSLPLEKRSSRSRVAGELQLSITRLDPLGEPPSTNPNGFRQIFNTIPARPREDYQAVLEHLLAVDLGAGLAGLSPASEALLLEARGTWRITHATHTIL